MNIDDYNKKKKILDEKIENYTNSDVLLAFSGGVDSSLLLKLLCDKASVKGNKVYAITASTKLHPTYEMNIARRVAKEMGAVHSVVKVDELEEAGIEYNPVNRCYLCKKCIFGAMKKLANDLQFEMIIEGTNADDLKAYRPGIRAIKELKVKSPLAESGMTKEEIRDYAEELGISVAGRPSTPCLATRFTYGTHLTYEAMNAVEKCEEYLKTLGLYNVRVRVHNDIVRIEVDLENFNVITEHRDDIVSYFKTYGYNYITLDMEGFRSGSMDVGLSQEDKDE